MRAFSERLGSSVRGRTAAVGSVEKRTQQRQIERRKRRTHAGKQRERRRGVFSLADSNVRTISIVIPDECDGARTNDGMRSAAAARATCFRTSFEEQQRQSTHGQKSTNSENDALRRAYFEKLVRDELEKDALLPTRTERMALVVPRSSFLSSSSPSSSSSSSSFEIEEEYLVVERIIEKQGEEQKQDEDDAFVVVATLDYVVADKLQGEVLHGDKGNGQAFDSAKYAFNEATQTYEFMPKTIERAYCFNVCVLPRYRGQGLAHRLIREAVRRVALKSVKFLYVHVEIQNTSALRCYESFGFSEEKKESELVAINLGRPPRKLLFVPVAPVAEACVS